jgi:hypothetical protein
MKKVPLDTAGAAKRYQEKRIAKLKADPSAFKGLKKLGVRGKRLLKGDKETTEKAKTMECECPGMFGHVCAGKVDPHHIVNRDEIPEQWRNDPRFLIYLCRVLHDIAHKKRRAFNALLGKRYTEARRLSHIDNPKRAKRVA